MPYAKLTPPVAQVVPANLEKHGHVRTDNYHWLNERDNPEVLAYLEAENAYTEAAMAHTGDLQQALFEEIRDRDHFYVRTNDQAKNFRLIKTPVGETGKEVWQEVIPHRDDVLLEGFEIFRDHLVVLERERGLVQIRLRPWSGGGEHYLDFAEPAYLAYLSDNHDFDTPILRYTYTSMTTPKSVFDYNMITREKELLKQEKVLGGFDAQHYQTERLSATAEDGTQIPISFHICFSVGPRRHQRVSDLMKRTPIDEMFYQFILMIKSKDGDFLSATEDGLHSFEKLRFRLGRPDSEAASRGQQRRPLFQSL